MGWTRGLVFLVPAEGVCDEGSGYVERRGTW